MIPATEAERRAEALDFLKGFVFLTSEDRIERCIQEFQRIRAHADAAVRDVESAREMLLACFTAAGGEFAHSDAENKWALAPEMVTDLMAALRSAERERDLAESLVRAQEEEPIPMTLDCPACGLWHLDGPDPASGWTNPPHKSHLCRPEHGGCGHVWRPCDRPTTGVLTVATRGSADHPGPEPSLMVHLVDARRQRDEAVARAEAAEAEAQRLRDAHIAIVQRAQEAEGDLLPLLNAANARVDALLAQLDRAGVVPGGAG